jgi:hypothetical protein
VQSLSTTIALRKLISTNLDLESIIYGETPFEGTVLENITFKK